MMLIPIPHDGTNFCRAEIRARARARNALEPVITLRRPGCTSGNAQHLARLVLVHQLVGRDVALFLQNARDLRLQLRNRDVNALVLGGRRVAEARQKIAMGSVCIILLVGSYQLAFVTPGFRPSAPYRENRFGTSELANISARAAAAAAAVAYSHLEFRLLERLGDFCCACHLLCCPFSRNGNPAL